MFAWWQTEDWGPWQKSPLSGNGGNCVEVKIGRRHVRVRDTKIDDSPELEFSKEVWHGFLAEIRSGRYRTRRRWYSRVVRTLIF